MLDVLPEKPPEPVNDLGTRLHGELLPVTRFQLVDLRVVRLDPGWLVVHVDLLLLVHYIAVHHLRQLQFVGTGPVGVQHHLPVGENLLPNGHPVSLADWPGSRGTPARDSWVESEEAQGLSPTTLDNARPLLPLQHIGLVLGSLHLTLAQVHLVRLHVHPSRGSSVGNALLLLHDVAGPRHIQVSVDPLYDLVVDIQEKVCGISLHTRSRAEEDRSLSAQWSSG